MTTDRKRVAPYATASAVSSFFDHIRYVRTPEKVESGLLIDYGISQSQAFPLLSTLKFLGIIESDGTPNQAFRTLQTGGEEFRTALAELVQRSYSDLFSRLDMSRDTRDKIKNFFARNYSPATAERATTLFLDLCGKAGIPTAAAEQQRQSAASTPTPKAKRPRPQTILPPSIPPTPPSYGRVVIELRLTEDDLKGMTPGDIAAVFDAAGKIEIARRKSQFRQPNETAEAGDESEQA
jgi:hypothetical protein